MLKINFSPEALHRAVPAFSTPQSEVFTLIAPFFEAALVEITDWMGSESVPLTLLPQVERLCYVMGCRRAVPHLDLVLTPFGFGVVSNDHHAPASTARVGALAEELRHDESRTRDALVVALLATPWATTMAARRLVQSLLWSPTLLRQHGVCCKGAEVFDREYDALRPSLMVAEREAARIISPELMAALIRRERLTIEDDYDLYDELRRAVAHFMASVMMERQGQPVPDLAEALRTLLDFVRSHRDQLPEYAASTTCQAHDLKPYQNEADHPTFFFA